MASASISEPTKELLDLEQHTNQHKRKSLSEVAVSNSSTIHPTVLIWLPLIILCLEI